ncbi:hypothetical protein B566_EDAN011494 [Ephemera danica]|nr:hypothetical protein B566_EDAN011494 [Ephemera danica]
MPLEVGSLPPSTLENEATGGELRELLDKIHALPVASPQTPAASAATTAAHDGGYAPLSQGSSGCTLSSRRPRRASWLSLASPRGSLPPGGWGGVLAASRSAPSTPSSQLAPPLASLLQNEGSSPLLEADSEEEDEERDMR